MKRLVQFVLAAVAGIGITVSVAQTFGGFGVSTGHLGNGGAAVTSNYQVAPTDCGKTLQLGTGATGLLTLTFPASLTGFPVPCIIDVVDADTGRGKKLVGLTGLTDMFPAQVSQASILPGVSAWTLTSNPAPWIPTSNVTFCVDAANGSDTLGDGLTPYSVGGGVGSCATPAQAFKTIQHCVDVASGRVFLRNDLMKITCKIADNTNITQDSIRLRKVAGNTAYQFNQTTISGNCTTPGNVAMTGTGTSGATFFLSASIATAWLIDCMDIAPTGSGNTAIFADWHTTIDFGSIRFTAPMTQAVVSRYNSSVEIVSGSAIVVSANMNQFCSSYEHGIVLAQGGTGSSTMTLSASPTWSNGFANIATGGVCDLNAITFSGASHGPKFFISGLGDWGAADPSTYPGDAAGIGVPYGARSTFKSIAAGGTSQTASTSYVMMGLKGAITPSVYGSALVTITGEWSNGSGGADLCSAQIAYGTGTAPNNGAAATGTVVGVPTRTGSTAYTNGAWVAYITGLTVNTAYWFDLQFKTTTTGPCIIGAVNLQAVEE